MTGGRCGSRVRFVLGCLASWAVGGCSEGQWFPEVAGRPKGDERLYHSHYNTDPSLWPTRSPADEAADRAARRERDRQRDHRDQARYST